MSIMSVEDLPVSDIDFSADAYMNEPHKHLAEMRKQGRMVYHPKTGYYILTTYRDVARVLGKAALFASDSATFSTLFGGHSMLSMDNPKHNEVRSVWATQFQRDSIEKYTELITEVVDTYVDDYLARLRTSSEPLDAVAEMTRPIPTVIIARLLGVPREDFSKFSRWSDEMSGILEGSYDVSPYGQAAMETGLKATASMNAYVGHAVQRRRETETSDLIADMVHSPVAKDMEESEIIASNTALIFAGNETTSKLMSQVLYALERHPEQREMLRQDRSLIPAAIEEVHRWIGVVFFQIRYVRDPEGAEVAGVHLPQGAPIMTNMAAANHDPERWENPERFDITRPRQPHVAFGFGPHTCLGLNLARLEIETLLNKMLDLHPDWQIEGEINWGTNPNVRGPHMLFLRPIKDA